MADSIEIIRCKDCEFWRDELVKLNSGRLRQYIGDERDALGVKHMVDIDTGLNVGAKCMYEHNRGWNTDHTTYRNADDYCSRARKRPCSYEKWYGIVDYMYPEGNEI